MDGLFFQCLCYIISYVDTYFYVAYTALRYFRLNLLWTIISVFAPTLSMDLCSDKYHLNNQCWMHKSKAKLCYLWSAMSVQGCQGNLSLVKNPLQKFIPTFDANHVVSSSACRNIKPDLQSGTTITLYRIKLSWKFINSQFSSRIQLLIPEADIIAFWLSGNQAPVWEDGLMKRKKKLIWC